MGSLKNNLLGKASLVRPSLVRPGDRSSAKRGAGGLVDLGNKMIRDSHVEALCKAVNKYEVNELNLNGNQLGDAGAEAIAAIVRTNRSVTHLSLAFNKIGDTGKGAAGGRQSRAARASKELRPYSCTGPCPQLPRTFGAWALNLENQNYRQRLDEIQNLLEIRVQLSEYYNFGRIEPGRHGCFFGLENGHI